MYKTMNYRQGQALAYAEYGAPNGFPILIQHGMIASISEIGLFARLIDAGARLVCIARPGYGASSPHEMKTVGEWGEIVAALVEHLGLKQLDVFGISSGAPYSYAIAQRMPEQVRQVYILSGTPALFDRQVAALWPYPLNPHALIDEMQMMAYELFFAPMSEDELEQPNVKDSLKNGCFGIALDLKIRCRDWGFALSDVRAPVIMRHSKMDESVPFRTAELTAHLLPDCHFEARERGPHFSQQVLDDFILTQIAPQLAK